MPRTPLMVAPPPWYAEFNEERNNLTWRFFTSPGERFTYDFRETTYSGDTYIFPDTFNVTFSLEPNGPFYTVKVSVMGRAGGDRIAFTYLVSATDGLHELGELLSNMPYSVYTRLRDLNVYQDVHFPSIKVSINNPPVNDEQRRAMIERLERTLERIHRRA